MNPGATTWPLASIVRAAGASIDGAMRTIVSPRIGEVAAIPRAAGAVDDAAVPDQEVVGRTLCARPHDNECDKCGRTEHGNDARI